MISREASSSSTSSTVAPIHPFANTTKRLEIIPNGIDVEEESRVYDDLCEDEDPEPTPRAVRRQSRASSVFSGQSSIWLEERFGTSMAFARDVKISGWTSVGDKPGGGYIVYDCVIKTKEDTIIHAHKRYSAFVDLDNLLRDSLPFHMLHFIPKLPPKTPLARYRPAFLDRRRRLLQNWLSAVLLHPDIGGNTVVRRWIME